MSPSALHYPWGQTRPETGESMNLRSGVHWIRMPLPFALDHINLWMLDDEIDGHPGWALVDAGVATEAIRDAWRTVWANRRPLGPLQRVLVTHMHPDHVGNAQWLIDQFSAPGHSARLWMSAADHLAAQLSSKETTGYGGEAAMAFFHAHGLQDAHALAQIRQRSGYYASMVPEVPRVYRRMMDGMTITVGARSWQCLAGYGHAPEHIALFDEQDHLLIAGDMLLPRISTNVSVIHLEPEGDPLGLYLDSIAQLMQLPQDTLVLPSHGLPFVGVHARVEQLHAHHRDRLDDVRRACKEGPQTAAGLLPLLFKRDLDLHQTTFAMGESIAHLNHLWHRGEIQRHQNAQGIWQFSA
ncbi:MAG: MBL fold metallo-hydrolase [Acidobacteriota bacterium]